MAAKRILALAFAVLIVGAAFLVRGRLDGDGDAWPDEATVVYCEPVLIEACREVFARVVSQNPGVILERMLAPGRPDAAVWITGEVWFDLLAAELSRQGRTDVLDDRSSPLAWSTLVVAGAMRDCGEPTWRCLARTPGKIGVDGLDTTTGLISTAFLVAEVMETTEFSRDDLRDGGYATWSRQFSERVERDRQDRSALYRSFGLQGLVEAAVGTAAEAASLDRSGDVVPVEEPPVVVRLAMVGLGDASLPSGRVVNELIAALVADGWESGDAPDGTMVATAGLVSLWSQ